AGACRQVNGIAGLLPVPTWIFQPTRRASATTKRDQDGPSPRRLDMRCYSNPHRFYAGVDLHARTMYTHVLDQKGKTVFEKDLPAEPEVFLDAVRPFRDDLVVGAECMFAWYWLADLCQDH